MARLAQYLNDAGALKEGDWYDNFRDLPGFRVKLRPLSCDAAAAHQDRIITDVIGVKGARSLKRLPPEVVAYAQARTLIDVCVADWEGLDVPVDAAGNVTFDPQAMAAEKALPFSKALLTHLLLEPAPENGFRTDPPPGEAARRYKTPDGLMRRSATRDFLAALIAAAVRVDELDAGEDREAEEGGDAGGAEKNAPAAGTTPSPTGSPGTAENG